MKVSDYIVEFLIKKGISDVFGYPGGMVTHLMDSLKKYKSSITAHVNYHEQASAFSACGYATIERPGVAYATSGPGATNLITGICNSYFDSIPTLFLTGQVNTYECNSGTLLARQIGFQETDIVSMVKGVTKYAVKVTDADSIVYHLDKAYKICLEGRPGPVLLDIPMDILRSDIKIEEPQCNNLYSELNQARKFDIILDELKMAKRPCLLIGSGIKISNMTEPFRELSNKLKIPVISSMLAVDVMPSDSKYYFGFIGAYGHRTANFLLGKCDLIISLGSRLDYRQTGTNLAGFASGAKLVRIDIDECELSNKIKDHELQIIGNLKEVLPYLNAKVSDYQSNTFYEWYETCQKIKSMLTGIDNLISNQYIAQISDLIEDNVIITTDVGQNQVWVAQSFRTKKNQKILFSGGHGSMGYSLPAAIGAHYGYDKKVISFCGDGGFQMNIQELQTIARENIPIKIVLLNNSSLGMIRHFQEMYFKSNFFQTQNTGGYTVPDFGKVVQAYGINYTKIEDLDNVSQLKQKLNDNLPRVIEVVLPDNTYVYPKLAMGKPNNDQEPELDRKLYQTLLDL